ncbi:ATP-grasp domain-containing protein [Aquimarina longa]|uniref:ATP-grasp domain-containing protein n=1 Tax=Aquimarina longa TaxID=1080221 RepID=UPI000782F1FC|nr:hypothetical protein [Aquimarina longa]
MKSIVALTDYKSKFGSKHFDVPYRSGMDKDKLSKYFYDLEYRLEYKYFNDINLADDIFNGRDVIYTSSEDIGYKYKSYIEDIIYALELSGVTVIPAYKHLKANNNKVFMELMRQYEGLTGNIESQIFGSMKDLLMHLDTIQYPIVFKTSGGASGTGVCLIKSEKELIGKVKEINKREYSMDLRDYGRSLKHKGYIRESLYREKFILQKFIPDLQNDWKVYIFGERLYIFKRPLLKGRGIKASGGGYDNYFYGLEAEAPNGLFDFAQEIYKKLDVPHVSIDIAYDGDEFYLIEFQSLYFGTAGIPYSQGYFTKKEGVWDFITEKLEIEKAYADSIVLYIEKKTIKNRSSVNHSV